MLGEPAGTEGRKRGEAWSQPPPAAVSNFPESSAAQESPSSHSRLPLVSGMEDAEPGWLPSFPPLLPEPLSGRTRVSPLWAMSSGGLPTRRGGPWMSPRNFPDEAGKFCMVLTTFPAQANLCAWSHCLLLLLLLLSFFKPLGRKGHRLYLLRGPKGK